jgi:hypothetical protein
MTLYQILDEKNSKINEFQQREMALCHLDVVKELSPEHHYHINVGKFNSSYQAIDSATNLTHQFWLSCTASFN